jgi:hypothetical protein
MSQRLPSQNVLRPRFAIDDRHLSPRFKGNHVMQCRGRFAIRHVTHATTRYE